MGILVTNASRGNGTTVEVATKKVVKVTSKYKSKNSKQRVTLCGKAKDGTIVWKFVSPYLSCTEMSNNDYFVNNNTVYLFSDKLYAINKTTGKVKWTYDDTVYSPSVAFGKQGNIYYIGGRSDNLISLSPKGKVKFIAKVPSRYMWPDEVKIASGKIKVHVVTEDEAQIDYVLIYDKKGNLLSERVDVKAAAKRAKEEYAWILSNETAANLLFTYMSYGS